MLSSVKALPYKRENERVVLIIIDRNMKSKEQDRPPCVLSLPVTVLVRLSGLPKIYLREKKEQAICLSPPG